MYWRMTCKYLYLHSNSKGGEEIKLRFTKATKKIKVGKKWAEKKRTFTLKKLELYKNKHI